MKKYTHRLLIFRSSLVENTATHNSKNTITYFSVNDKNEKVKSANLTTYSKKIDKILKKKSDEENLFKLESITQND